MSYYGFEYSLNKFLATLIINSRLYKTTANAYTLNQVKSLIVHPCGLKIIANIKLLKSTFQYFYFTASAMIVSMRR